VSGKGEKRDSFALMISDLPVNYTPSRSSPRGKRLGEREGTEEKVRVRLGQTLCVLYNIAFVLYTSVALLSLSSSFAVY
jgi:hypothetical protein